MIKPTPNSRLLNALPPARPAEEGLALFVVLVVVLVLSVLVTQLAVTTKVEERISYQHQGFLQASYSLQSVARRIASSLYDDWLQDLEGAEDGGVLDEAADPTGGAAGMGAGDEAEGGETTAPLDELHEDWRHEKEEIVNDWRIRSQITDGESCLSIQHIFWYVNIEDDPQNPKAEHTTLWQTAMQTEDGEFADDDSESLPETAAPADGEAPLEVEPDIILEFQMPSEERIEKTKAMLSRLVEAVVVYNADFSFPYYDDPPNPDAAAEAIAEWALERMREESTRRIRSLEPLKYLQDVGWELYHGPPNPADEENEDGAFNPSDFEDDYDDWDELADQFNGGGPFPWFEEVDGGVKEIPRPLGLRHVLTAYSTGRINLNTVRPEVITALLIDMEYEIAFEDVADPMDVWRNAYVFAEEGEEEVEATEEEDAASAEFNVFTAIEDVLGLEENEEFEVLIDRDLDFSLDVTNFANEQETVQQVIQRTLQPVSTYQSTYFTAKLVGDRGDQRIEGELVLVRDDKKVKVLSWREIAR